MLHHANTDRLIALWQAIYYDNTTFNFSYASSGQLGTKKGTTLTPDSPLKPFHAAYPATNDSAPPSDAGGFFHTSHSVADLRTFGYSYPELSTDWQTADKEKLAAEVKKAVNKLYGSGDDDDGASADGVARRDVDEDLDAGLEEQDDTKTTDSDDGDLHIEENNKITFRRSRFRSRSRSLSRSLKTSTSTSNSNSKDVDADDTKTTDGYETEENNKITFHRSRSLARSLSSASANPMKGTKRQSYGQQPTKNYYYTAELSVDRSEVPLPCTISLIVNGVVMGRMSLLGMPMEGIAKMSIPLRRPLDDAYNKKSGNGNTNGGQQTRSLKGRRIQMRAAVAATEEAEEKPKRGLAHVRAGDMTPKKIIPFLRGNMTVEIRSVSTISFPFLPFLFLCPPLIILQY